jgi:putative spermidine/putrescine transport system ATP-binding protein
MSFLRLENLAKRFGDFVAVDDISLSVEKGEFVSLLGPSGCGKTTTLQLIAGFLEPSAGKIFIDGEDFTRVKPNQRGLGIVFQTYALFPHMTVAGNVSFGLEMRKVPKAERLRRVEEVLELVHLEPFAHRFPRELSGGQRQRVALARALVIKPPLLLLDEPLSNLDAKLREGMQLELRDIQQTVGTTTILVTHDQAEALSMSDRVVVMNKGRMVQVDSPYDAYESPRTIFVSDFVGKSNLLSGTVTRRTNGTVQVRVGEAELELNSARANPTDSIRVSIRPEKLQFTNVGEGRLNGRIHTRLFLGNHWLYQVDTPAGRLLVTRQNTGIENPREGGDIGLTWDPGAIRELPGEQADG